MFGQCPEAGAKIIQATHLNTYDLRTCVNIRNYSDYLTSFLDGCTFEHSAEATGKGACHYECLYGHDCHALVYTAADGCQICRSASSPTSGNGNSYRVADVFVAGWMLRSYIDG